jgi:hypothetical protein
MVDYTGSTLDHYTADFGSGGTYDYVFGGAATGYTYYWRPRSQSVAAAIAPAAVAASTGVNPVETSYSLYGHIIPLTVFGFGRIGTEIIAGPVLENGCVSGIWSAGVPADPSGTRYIREIAFDSQVVWSTNSLTATAPGDGTFSTEPFTWRFYGGSLTQPADAFEILHSGAQANAYRPQILIAIDNLPLANQKFKKAPYVSIVVGDASGDDVNLGEAFERLAASPWVNFTQFETIGITDALPDGGLIIVQDVDFLSLIQQFGRFYPTLDILQTDKLRIVDRGADVTADIILDKTRLMSQIQVNRQGADTVSKDLELSTIDPDADYTIVPSLAQIPRDPVAVTTSVGKDTAYLPAIMDSFTRASIVTYAKYHEEAARKSISGTAMAYGLEIEPGALVRIRGLGDDFNNETFKVAETTHGVNNVVEFVATAILKCSIGEPVPTMPALTGLIGWWDASIYASLGLTGSTIDTVADQSGAGNNLGAFGANAKPTYNATGFNSRPAMIFSRAADSALGLDPFPMGTGNTLTFWWVATRTVATENNARSLSYTAAGQSHDWTNAPSWAATFTNLNEDMHLERHSLQTPISESASAGAPTRFIGTIDSSGAMVIYVNGIATSPTIAAGNWTTGGGLVVGRGKFDTASWDGAVAECGIATGYHGASVIAQLDEFLAYKWGI